MDLRRTNLLLPLREQQAVPVDWPTRVGYPPPGVTRLSGYPAGAGPEPLKKRKRRKHRHEDEDPQLGFDAEYPCTPEGKKIAKAHAWQFPSKRIKVCGKILKY